MSLPSAIDLRIDSPAEVHTAGEQARTFAGQNGFAGSDGEEVALAVVELASNLVKHAGGGELHLKPLDSDGRRGVEIVSEDRGPGIPEPEKAIADGFSTAGSRGVGLGAVNRLMDEMEFCPRPDGGARIVCQRWVRPRPTECGGERVEFGAASRAYRFQPINGDALVVRQWPDHALAGIIDGLGHGPFAQRAAQCARHYLEQHFHQGLDSLFRGVGRACRATRGVVLALARFDFAKHTVELASVGNIEVWLLGRQQPFQPVVRRGIVGVINAPAPMVTEHPWTAANVLILHSDGIQSGWDSAELCRLSRQSAVSAARCLLEGYGRLDDDATVLVARASADRAKEVPRA